MKYRLKKNIKQQGSTLIEVLLYAVLAVLLFEALAGHYSLTLRSRARSQAAAEVEWQGQRLLNVLASAVRNAESVTVPGAAASSGALELANTEAAKNPALFSTVGSGVFVQYGALPAVALTNDNVEVSSLNFSNLSRSGTPGIVRISFTLTFKGNGRPENNYSRNFYGAASLK